MNTHLAKKNKVDEVIEYLIYVFHRPMIKLYTY